MLLSTLGAHDHTVFWRLTVQEEQKVERMRIKLEELGVDVDSLLEGIGDVEEADGADGPDLT